MPEYSSLAQSRDVFGEIGWIPNFEVKNSKNNEVRHSTMRETFDNPKDYSTEFQKLVKSDSELLKSIQPAIT
jgi:hypothetical protein